MIGVANDIAMSGDSIDPRLLGELLDGDLIPKANHSWRLRADENDSCLLKLPGESRLFGKKSVPRMHCLSPALLARLDNAFDRQIALRGNRRSNANGLIRH